MLAQALKHLHAGELGKIDIQQHKVKHFSQLSLQGCLTIGYIFHEQPLRLKVGSHYLDDRRFIIDDKNFPLPYLGYHEGEVDRHPSPALRLRVTSACYHSRMKSEQRS